MPIRWEKNTGNHSEKFSGYEIRELWPRIRILGVAGGNPACAKPLFSGQLTANAAICRWNAGARRARNGVFGAVRCARG